MINSIYNINYSTNRMSDNAPSPDVNPWHHPPPKTLAPFFLPPSLSPTDERVFSPNFFYGQENT